MPPAGRGTAARIRDEVDSEMARLGERIARDYERRRRQDRERSRQNAARRSLGDHLAELSDTFNREMRKKDAFVGSFGGGPG
ncbi:MAG: hypothetical protein GY711_12015 [bacterium]|nr:hypothetical protein [bacterium]